MEHHGEQRWITPNIILLGIHAVLPLNNHVQGLSSRFLPSREGLFLGSHLFQVLNRRQFGPLSVPGTLGVPEGKEVLLCSQIKIFLLVKAIPGVVEMQDWEAIVWEALPGSVNLHSNGW